MHDILFTPSPERVATTNAWACLCRLSLARGAAGPATDGAIAWAALRRAIAADPAEAAAALAAFAAVPARPARLALPGGAAPALVLHPPAGPARAFSGDDLAGRDPDLPAPVAAALARAWDPARLLMLRVGLLLHLDLRPDDVVLLAGLPAGAWLPALTDGTRLILAGTTPARLLPLAAETRATVLAAPAGWIAAAAFPRSHRPDLAALRSLVALGGPMAPAARARVYAWIKPDVMLLARAGDRFWGNPLSPVRARPAPEPRLLTASGPRTVSAVPTS